MCSQQETHPQVTKNSIADSYATKLISANNPLECFYQLKENTFLYLKGRAGTHIHPSPMFSSQEAIVVFGFYGTALQLQDKVHLSP